jgi:hypothetical protein
MFHTPAPSSYRSDVMKFEVEKRSWPSFADKGNFEVHIDEPGFDLAIGIVVVQPGVWPGSQPLRLVDRVIGASIWADDSALRAAR